MKLIPLMKSWRLRSLGFSLASRSLGMTSPSGGNSDSTSKSESSSTNRRATDTLRARCCCPTGVDSFDLGNYAKSNS